MKGDRWRIDGRGGKETTTVSDNDSDNDSDSEQATWDSANGTLHCRFSILSPTPFQNAKAMPPGTYESGRKTMISSKKKKKLNWSSGLPYI